MQQPKASRAGLEFLAQKLVLPSTVLRETLEDGAIVLSDTDRAALFDDDVYKAVLPLLDGSRTGSDLAREASAAGYGTFDVVEALLQLQSAGWIDVARLPLAVTVITLVGAPDTAIRAAIEAAPDLDLFGEAGVVVAVAADYLDDELRVLADVVETPLILCRATPNEIWLGPLLVPGETACWECLAHRLRRHREVHTLVSSAAAAAPSALDGLAELLVAQLQVYARSTRDHPLAGVLVALDRRRLTASRHVVTRRPQCTRCGGRAEKPVPVQLAERRRIGDGESGFRAVGPEDLLRDYGHHISPITGIAKGIWRVGDEDAVHVYRAPHMSNQPAVSWENFRVRGRNAAGGKGTTSLQGRASALGEALERYSSVWDGTEPIEIFSYADLSRGDAPILHPRECMLFSDAQYRDREAINVDRKSFKEHVPVAFDEDDPIHWTRIWSLTHECWTWAPAAYVYFCAPQDEERRYLVGESNGNAAAGRRSKTRFCRASSNSWNGTPLASGGTTRCRRRVCGSKASTIPTYRRSESTLLDWVANSGCWISLRISPCPRSSP